ncbi:tetratricopeptide repeat protein [Ancylomarina salipaludis]|uniref:histidine kinase n=1 Tax=Ancylomarina salipaludis TaxID=2501299 RepID=A0A4Q1JNI0_9BACT|nr:tetratricopeptide repeat protein [Ancylomarina salipaludis]RXQ96238.1 tetratricopeptide repeat protein [Ancylomarina salipaludis]
MSKYFTPLLLLFLISIISLSFTSPTENTDSISNYLSKQYQKHQENNFDSAVIYARRLIKHTELNHQDSLMIRTQQNLGWLHLDRNQLDSAIYYLNIALINSELHEFPKLSIRSHIILGYYYITQSDYRKAIEQYQTALDLAQQHHALKYEAISYNELGNAYWEQGYIQKALQAFLNANTIIEKNNIESLKTNTLVNIANIYIADNQYEKALAKLNEVLELSKESNNIANQAIANNNIGTIYESQKDYTKALIYYLKALELRKSEEGSPELSSNYHNLGSVNYELGDYEQAIYFLHKSLAIAKENNLKVDFIYNYEYLAKVYIKTKKFDKASDFLKKAIKLADELGLINKKLDLAKVQTEYYLETGKINQAKKAFFSYDSLKEDFIKNEKTEQIIRMQTLYETEKKEKENALLKTQNQLSKLNLEKEIQRKDQVIIGLVLTLALLLVIIILLRNMTKANKTIKNINLKLEDSNEQLKIINKTKDKFFSIIAHDLRSPLGAILSFSNLIHDESNSSQEISLINEYNTYLNQSARNLNSLLENLLQWSKSQLGNMKYQAIDFDLSEIVQENIEIQKLKSKEKSITFISKLNSNMPVFADINMVNTIIRNLLSNALKFSYPESEIIISAQLNGDTIQLAVQDFGVGMNMDKQSKLFSIENNVSTLGTKQETGTGLGLILCKEFVEANGGQIWIESEEKKGSTFTFTLPLSPNVSI